MEERRFGQTHPDVLALNPLLEACLESLAGDVAFLGRCHTSSLLAVFFKVGTAVMMPHSYISEREVDYSPPAACSLAYRERAGKHFSRLTWCSLKSSSTFRPRDVLKQNTVIRGLNESRRMVRERRIHTDLAVKVQI